MIREITDIDKKRQISASILSALPNWFGLPESTWEYIEQSTSMPFWAAYDENTAIGFVAMKQTGQCTAEIYVMGVLPSYHRSGTGRALYEAMEHYARELGCEFVQVKTVQMGRYLEYDHTNRFYLAMGFREFECFPTLWDEWNPCQVYVKYIGE